MSLTISELTQNALEVNEADNRSCANMGGRCSTPASMRVTQQVWSRRINEGAARELTMTLCPRHAATIPVGFIGRNFTVTAQNTY